MSKVLIPSTSLQYVKVGPVRLQENGVVVDPTDSVVELAFTGGTDDPDEADWTVGSWESGGGRYMARVLVGPAGDVTLAEGTFYVWIRLTRDPERPVQMVDNQVQIT